MANGAPTGLLEAIVGARPRGEPAENATGWAVADMGEAGRCICNGAVDDAKLEPRGEMGEIDGRGGRLVVGGGKGGGR